MTYLGKNPQGYKEYKHGQTGIVFVYIPGGTFQMGDDEFDNTKPIHNVALNDFLIGKSEVTQGVWQKIENIILHIKGGDDIRWKQSVGTIVLLFVVKQD